MVRRCQLILLLSALIGAVACGSSTPIVQTAPTISASGQPQSATINSGQTATLTVAAAGTAPLSYQWYQGMSGDTSNKISGATSASFTTPALTVTTSYWVQVTNSAGNANSNTATITVTAVAAPVLTTLSPSSVTAGSAAFTLTVNGSGFISSSQVQWNGSNRTTTFVSATQVTAAITAADVLTAGSATVTVVNSGASSNGLTFTINAITNPVPVLTTLSPSNTAAGSAAFTLTVNGTGLISSSQVQWNGSNRTTTFVSATQVTAAITAADVLTAGSATVTVVNPAPGGGTSNGLTFTINPTNPVPVLTTLSPSSKTAGSAAFTLTVNGTGLISSSQVQWNGSNRTTTFVSSTQVTAAITAADVLTAGSATVTVVNPGPGGGTSNGLTFTISSTNPVPALTTLSPSSTTAGSAAFTLTVNGTGLISSSQVQWNGSNRTTTFVSATQVTAAITAADVLTAGSATVTVVNPAPGGGTSNGLTFTINSTNPVPVLTTLSPSSKTAGSAAFTLTVNGTGFVSSSQVQWNSSNRTTTFVSSTQVTAAITAADVLTAGPATVTVVNPAPGGGTSNGLTFSVNNPVPALTTLSPSSTTAGSAAFTLTVNGSGFVSNSQVQWNSSNRTTTYVSSTQVQAAITATDVQSVGSATVTVVNPTPGGGTSNGLTFNITSATTLTSISPITIGAGTPGFQLSAIGTGFNGSSQIQFNGTALSTVLVSSTQLTAIVPAADIASSGTATITVSNASGSAQTLTIAASVAPQWDNSGWQPSIPGANNFPNIPIRVAWDPGDSSLFVAEQEGSIVHLTKSGTWSASVWATVPTCRTAASPCSSNSNLGLLGMAIDPSNPPSQGGVVYVFYSASSSENRIAIMTAGASTASDIVDSLPADISSPFYLNGGRILVQADPTTGVTYIYASTGGDDTAEAKAQTLVTSSPLAATYGKILRFDTNGTAAGSSQFTGTVPGTPTYACGLRNAFGFDLHPTSGALYAIDNGNESDWDDALDRINTGGGDAEGYGFPSRPGTDACSGTETAPLMGGTDATFANQSRIPVGSIFYTNPFPDQSSKAAVMPQLENTFLVIGNSAPSLYSYAVDEYNATLKGKVLTSSAIPLPANVFPLDMVEGTDGCVYVVGPDGNSKFIYRFSGSTAQCH